MNPDTVTHLSTNRARRWLTSLIEANALTTKPGHHQWRMTLGMGLTWEEAEAVARNGTGKSDVEVQAELQDESDSQDVRVF